MAKAKAANGKATLPAPDPSFPVVSVPLDSLHEDPANARTHPERNLATIRASLLEFGQVEPLVVHKGTGKVIGGNGRLAVMRELGWDRVAVHEFDGTPTQAAALGIVLNRSGDLAGTDGLAMANLLRALESESFDLSAIGYDAGEVDALIEGLARGYAGGAADGSGSSNGSHDGSGPAGDKVDDPAGEWRGMPEFQHEDQESAFKVHVHIRNEEDLADFERLVGQKVLRHRWAIWHPKAEIGRYADKRYTVDDPEAEGDESDGQSGDAA